jgi:hypothetical protein
VTLDREVKKGYLDDEAPNRDCFPAADRGFPLP